MNKDQYTFYTYGNSAQFNLAIQNYLASNNFEMQNTNGIVWYTVNDGLIYRCFEYYINDGTVTIYVYMNNFNKPASIMNNSYANNYVNSLQELLDTLCKINQNNTNSDYNMYSNCNQSVVNSFNNTVNTKNEQRATLGFIISIIVILASCLGVTAGVPLIALELWLASCGMKTSKRKLSIATFIMAGISAVMLIIQIFMMIF